MLSKPPATWNPGTARRAKTRTAQVQRKLRLQVCAFRSRYHFRRNGLTRKMLDSLPGAASAGHLRPSAEMKREPGPPSARETTGRPGSPLADLPCHYIAAVLRAGSEVGLRPSDARLARTRPARWIHHRRRHSSRLNCAGQACSGSPSEIVANQAILAAKIESAAGQHGTRPAGISELRYLERTDL